MAGLNKVMLIGNVGTEPEMRYTANGSAVTNFRLACSRSFAGQDGERREETEWFTVVCWNKLAETVSQFLQKGRRAYVEGRLQTRSWEGQDGQKRYRTEVIANTVLFLDRAQAAPMDEAMPPEQEEIPVE
jgi:single-strand DNA-binding protein